MRDFLIITGLRGPTWFFGAHDAWYGEKTNERKSERNNKQRGDRKNKRKEPTTAGLIGTANNANPRYLCLLSAIRLLKFTSAQDGYTKACSTQTRGLVGSLASRRLYQQSETTSSGPARRLARYLTPHIIVFTAEPTTTYPPGRMGSVPALCHLGP